MVGPLVWESPPKISRLCRSGGPVWSNDPESFASGSLAAGSASLVGQVKGDDPDTKGYPSPPGCMLER